MKLITPSARLVRYTLHQSRKLPLDPRRASEAQLERLRDQPQQDQPPWIGVEYLQGIEQVGHPDLVT
jgi:hypothetical protein